MRDLHSMPDEALAALARMPADELAALRDFARNLMASRPHDFQIGASDDPYLLRWWAVPRNAGANVYLHRILRDDDDRALHDHPWDSTSIILEGGYIEIVPVSPGAPSGAVMPMTRMPGDIVHRPATAAHRLALHRDADGNAMPCITLFATGPRIRDWGFWCPQGWRHWEDFCAPGDKGRVGRGCE